MTERRTNVLIAGAGVGGCAAALAVVEAGCDALLTEETDWIGGQLTAQATPPDEHGWIERFGCTRSYRRFRENVRAFYRRYYPLTTAASSNPLLNPGNGWVSPLCHEPRVALAVLEAMLAPHVSSGRLTILREREPIGAEITPGDHIAVVEFLDLKGGEKTAICADFIIDATELGDLLPLARTEFVTGFESRDETGEPSAPDKAQPENVQAFSVCFAMDHRDGEDHTIEKPNRYDYWREYVPELDPPWPGRLLSWTGLSPRTMEVSEARFSPNNEPPKRFAGFWSYRRILDRANFEDGRFDSDVCIVNWPMIDYLEGNLCTTDATEKSRIVEEAKEQSLAMLYWLQTEALRPDRGEGWPGLRLRNDIVGTEDGLAKYPYIRESRRIRAQFTVREQDVAAACRPERMLAEPFEDSVGVGYYRIDLHPSTGGDNYIDVACRPFQIPLGAFVPIRVENLLPACKNLGTTHITNGCFRLHPVEWNIGEAAGALSAFCLQKKTVPRQVYERPALREEFQRLLDRREVERAWPDDLNIEEGDPHAHAR